MAEIPAWLAPDAEDFDIREYTRTAVGSHEDTLPLDEFTRHPLSPEALRALAYLRDLERYTMHHLRNVLVTPSHKDARLTAFIASWAFEKYWIGDAFDRILAVHETPAVAFHRKRNGFVRFAREFADRVSPIITSIRANTIGEDFVAIHVTRGTVDELVSRASYTRLLEREPNGPLAEVIDRFQTLRARHLHFFEGETLRRLKESAKARALTRSSLKHSWTPTGTDDQAIEETRFMMSYVFGDQRGKASIIEIDHLIDALPGQEGLRVMSKATKRFGVDPSEALA